MGRRYYCDYCDKVFIDDIEARKKHLNCVHHLKQRKLHYDSFRDLSELLVEESAKTPCRRFLTSGYCQFDSACKYAHYSPEQLWKVKEMIIFEQQRKINKQFEHMEVPMPEEWLAKYMQKRDEQKESVAKVFWSYPVQLETRQDLPPSMRKFHSEDFHDSDFAEWGSSSK